MPKSNPTRTLEQWSDIIHEQRQSGLTIQQYCTQNALPLSSFYAWKKKVSGTNKTTDARNARQPIKPTHTPFIEIAPPLIPANDGPSHWTVELDLGNNIVLRVRV